MALWVKQTTTYELLLSNWATAGHSFLKNGPIPASFSFIFGLFIQPIQFFQQINVKNVHPVYNTGIQTHNHSNMSRHP